MISVNKRTNQVKVRAVAAAVVAAAVEVGDTNPKPQCVGRLSRRRLPPLRTTRTTRNDRQCKKRKMQPTTALLGEPSAEKKQTNAAAVCVRGNVRNNSVDGSGGGGNGNGTSSGGGTIRSTGTVPVHVLGTS